MTQTLQTPAPRLALCAGSFDPPTLGHINIFERALNVLDGLIIAIANSNGKNSLFNCEERMAMLRELLHHEPRIEIASFDGLLVNYAQERGVKVLVRGIRTVADYEYELQMSLANKMLAPDLETVFIMTEGRYSHISSTIIKQVIRLGGSGSAMVPPLVEEQLKQKLQSSPSSSPRK